MGYESKNISIIDVSKDDKMNSFFMNQFLAYRESRKAKMDDRQEAIQKTSFVHGLTEGEKKKSGVVMEMSFEDYYRVMEGTGDLNFWSDEGNRKKFLKAAPQYDPKNFKS